MRCLLAALAAIVCFVCAPLCAQQSATLDSRTLSLDEAFARVIQRHPDLARFRYLHDGAQAEIDEARQAPPLTADLQIENAPASGAASGFEQAEVTLSLASVLERGGKRGARITVAEAQANALTLEEEARRLDLLAEVARRYLDVIAAQSLVQIADAEITHRQHVVTAATLRVRAGASPDSVRLTAEAAVARSRLARERSLADWRAAARRLAVLWNDRDTDFESAAGDPFAMPTVPSLQSLQTLIDRSPELRRFADEARLREARVQLAQSARLTDVQWQAGLRRLESTDSWAAVVGVSVPLGASKRAAPGVRSAEASLAALSLERESQEISLLATLTDAQARLSAASLEVNASRADVLPRLQQAERAAEKSYRAGASSYLEWAQVQSDIAAVRREELQAALEAHRALIEIQRLTGESFIRSEKQP